MLADYTATADREPVLKPVPPVWQVEVDRATPVEWSQLLDLFYDANIYQTWSYGGVRWGEKNLSHLVLKKDNEVVGIAQLRIVRPTSFKFGMAYLRWGPLCHRRGTEIDREVAEQVARSLEEEYANKRKLLLQVLPNAFSGTPRAEILRSAFFRFNPQRTNAANTYRTFILDLAPSIEELRRNLDKKWRNQLTVAEKNKLRVLEGTSKDKYRIFCSLYREMRNRKTFQTTVDIEEFERVQEELPEAHRMRILICERDGIPVAGLVASSMGDSAIYLLGATSDSGLNAKGSYLLQWMLIQWLKKNGVKWYDLGGIDPEYNPGVYHFKRGLSGVDVSHLPSLVTCNSVVSSAIVRASLTAHRAVLNWMR
jgi:lipid II:glycine glycyltransferase (peptidoglycan interpeptide bridge formation enzyme)